MMEKTFIAIAYKHLLHGDPAKALVVFNYLKEFHEESLQLDVLRLLCFYRLSAYKECLEIFGEIDLSLIWNNELSSRLLAIRAHVLSVALE